jgi:hypothetical protein
MCLSQGIDYSIALHDFFLHQPHLKTTVYPKKDRRPSRSRWEAIEVVASMMFDHHITSFLSSEDYKLIR